VAVFGDVATAGQPQRKKRGKICSLVVNQACNPASSRIAAVVCECEHAKKRAKCAGIIAEGAAANCSTGEWKSLRIHGVGGWGGLPDVKGNPEGRGRMSVFLPVM